MVNEGKRFENNFRFSIPNSYFYYRLRDSAASYYGGNDFLRFSNKNIADNIVYGHGTLFINELKAHTGKSLPLSCIKSNQIEMMSDASQYDGIKCTLFVFFYTLGRCFALNIKDFVHFLEETDRKSIPVSFFEEYGIEIPVKSLKTNHRFALDDFFME